MTAIAASIIITCLITLGAAAVVYRVSYKRIRQEAALAVAEEYESKMKSLAEGQALLISQIQPHFLYNVLNTIKYLCKRNPDEALEAIDRFSAFLRKSMDSFNSTECIPLEQELDIVKNYVYLEKCRFGDKVEVYYEIQSKDFNVPPLSIQPMVENAVKHGITKNLGGGHIWIKTYEEPDNYVVEIVDDGVGFYVGTKAADDGKSHIGIKNTAQRIKTMSKGTFSVESEVGSSTRVLITIPKETICIPE